MEDNNSNHRNRGFSFRQFISGVLGGVLGTILLSVLGFSFFFQRGVQNNSRLTNPPQSVPNQIQEGFPQVDRLSTAVNQDVTTAAGKVIPSVVSIVATRTYQGKDVRGVGSGVIVDSAGYILTNNHVAGRGTRDIAVSLHDGTETGAKTVWSDPTLDLAIIKIEGGNFPTAALGDSKAVKIGEQAIAIGNPLGLTFQRTVTAGIISALNRTIEVERGSFMEGLIQTDASINPGNSGGPLINIKGEVVGINTIKVTTAEGMGFAVPINVAKPVIDKLRSGKGYTAPFTAMQALDKELGRQYGFTIDKGVYVYDCKDGGCVYKAGLRKGDAIIAVDDVPVNTAIDLKEALNRAGAGSKVKLRVKDSADNEKDVYVELEAEKEAEGE